MTLHILYDVTISLYALSICGYFIDFLENNRKVKRMAFWLLSIVWVLQLTIFLYKGVITDEFPVVTTTEGLFLLSWLIVTLSLLMNRLLKLDLIVFFSNLIGFMLVVISLFKPDSSHLSLQLRDSMTSDLLIIHISMALVSYALFTISFILSLMYHFEYRMLKQKKWGNRLVRFGSLTKIERYAAFCVLVGVPLLLTSLLLGVYRAFVTVPDFQLFDPKVMLSFIVLFVYSVYLYMRFAKHVHGKSLGFYNVVGFLLVIINVFLSKEVTNFHLW